MKEPLFTIMEVQDEQEIARFRAQSEQARRNSEWERAHWPELLPQALGKFLPVFKQVKQHEIPRRSHTSKAELRGSVEQGFDAYRKQLRPKGEEQLRFENVGGATLEFDAPASTPTTVLCNFTNSAYLKVDAGDAALISNAPVVGPPRTMNLDGNLALQGDLTLYGTIAAPTGLTMSAGGGTTGTTGTLSLPQGMSIDGSANMEVTDFSFLTGAGQLYNAGTLTLDIGSSTSGLGSYQESSTGTLDLKASSANAYSALIVSGGAQLSGTLKLDFENGYNPTKGTAFRSTRHPPA